MYPGSRRWKVVPCCWPGVPMGCLGFLKKGSFMPQEKRFPAEARRSEEHTSELQSRPQLVCRLLLEKKNRPVDRRDRGDGEADGCAARGADSAADFEEQVDGAALAARRQAVARAVRDPHAHAADRHL